MKTLALITTLAAATGSSISAADLDHDTVAGRIPTGETGFERDHLTGDWNGYRTRLVDSGVHIHLGHTIEVFSLVRGPGVSRGVVTGLGEASVDLDLDKLISWRGATARISGLYPHGSGLTKHLGDLGTVSNLDAYDSPRLYEFWIDQRFADDRLSLRVGQMGADEEFLGSDYAAYLINATFGWAPIVGLAAPTPAYPVAAPGVRLRWDVTERVFWQIGAYDGNADPVSSAGERLNDYGLKVNLNERDGAFLISEMGLARGGGSEALTGSYRVGGWWHTGDYFSRRFDDSGRSIFDPTSSGIPKSVSGNFGVYAVADHELWREADSVAEEPQGVGVFTRAGWAADDRNILSWYADAGLAYRGAFHGRDQDVLALGVAWMEASKEYKNTFRDSRRFTGVDSGSPSHEVVLEATYHLQITPWWMVQPDVQLIFNPGTIERSTAVVVGLRSTIIF